MRRTKNYKEHLLETLQTPEDIAGYINAVIEEGDIPTFLLALRDVADAQGLGKLAEEAKLNRENVYRMLSAKGNPTLKSLVSVLYVLGLDVRVEPMRDRVQQHSQLRAQGTTCAVATTVTTTSLGENAEIHAASGRYEGIDYESDLQTNAESLAA
jgi:probable addiction module antidote protein